MSGIAGVVRRGGPVDESEALAMARAQGLRGADGYAAWAGGGVGLGHAMLRTTPESLVERLPLRAGPFVVTADARVDNRDDLLPRLGGPLRDLGLLADVVPDSSLVLAAYAEWGEGCVERLVGDFAFAVWDGRERRLFCARDPFGVRPFFYVHRPGALFAFGSVPRALFALDDVPRGVNWGRVAVHLTAKLPEPVETAYEGVVRLPAASTLTLGADLSAPVVRTYWEPPAGVGGEPPGGWTARFGELFAEAVRCRVRSAFPVGAELSGGLDSSSVAVEAAGALEGGPLRTYTTVYPVTTECDESSYAQAVLEHLGAAARPTTVSADEWGVVTLTREIVERSDDVLSTGNHHLNYLTARAAGQDGARVLLTGQDGDTTVGHGYERLHDLVLRGDWDRLQAEAEAHVTRLLAERGAYAGHVTFERPDNVVGYAATPVLQYLAEVRAPVRFARTALALRRRYGVGLRRSAGAFWRTFALPRDALRGRAEAALRRSVEAHLPPTLTPGAVARYSIAERVHDHLIPERPFGHPLPTSRGRQAKVLRLPHLPLSLERVDLYAASWGVEARHPFMDVRLVEFCLGLPMGERFRDGLGRAVLRDALGDRLPESVRLRVNKANLEPQFRRFVVEAEERLVDEVVSGLRRERWGGVLDVAEVRRLWDARAELSPSETRWLAAAVNAALWLEGADRPTPDGT